MAFFQITSSAGVDMGTYQGATAAEALDAARAELHAVEVAPGALHDYEGGDYLRPATSAEAAESIAAARADGGAGVIAVDGRRCYVVTE